MWHWWKTAVLGVFLFPSSSCSSVWASVVHAAGVFGETPCTSSLISPFLHLLGGCEALRSPFCPFYFQSSSLSFLSFVLLQIDRDTYWCLLSFCSPFYLFLFVWTLLSSWNIPSNLIGKNKGTSFLIVWIDQIMTTVFSGFERSC